MVPVVILCGEAGSGKDTAAKFIVENGGVALGQADVLKHILRDLTTGFTDEHLFGPSEKRNEVVAGVEFWEGYEGGDRAAKWCQQIFPDRHDEAMTGLRTWIGLCDTFHEKNDGLSARFALQTLGTEWGRTLDPRIWTRYAFDTADQLLDGGYTYDRIKGLKECQGFTGYNLVAITDGRFRNEVLEAQRRNGLAVRVIRNDNLSADAQAAGIAGHQSETSICCIPDHFFDFVIHNNGSLDDLKMMSCIITRRLTGGWDYPRPTHLKRIH